MISKIKKLIIFSLAISLAFFVSAKSENIEASPSFFWHNADDVISISNVEYLPAKDVLSILGIETRWVSNGNEILELSKSGKSYQVVLDVDRKTASTGNVIYKFDMKDGKIYLPVKFYQMILDAQYVNWNSNNKSLAIIPNEGNQEVKIKGIINPVVQPVAKSESNSVASVTPEKNVATKPVQVIANKKISNLSFYESGQATWYGSALHGNLTASGERFNMHDLTAAHKTLPFGTSVKVTNMSNGLSVIVRITDRGPFAPGRVIDLSSAAAQKIDMISSGVVPVKLEIIK